MSFMELNGVARPKDINFSGLKSLDVTPRFGVLSDSSRLYI